MAQKWGNAQVRISGVHAGHGLTGWCYMTVGDEREPHPLTPGPWPAWC